MRERIKCVLSWLCLFSGVGIIYTIGYQQDLIHIPCIFHKVTGFYCPGCGITRMCLALIRLDFRTAFYYNQLIFILLPFGLGLSIWQCYRYIRTGETRLTPLQTSLLWVMLISLIVFGVLRNVPGLYRLRPI